MTRPYAMDRGIPSSTSSSPIGIAANICGVNVHNFIDSPDACDADVIEITRIT